MIKYSFGQEVEYVAIKEYEYDDLTNEDACQAYQEIFRNMDEGWSIYAHERTHCSCCSSRKHSTNEKFYSTVDACNTAKEMWTAIERLQQGESLNVQDPKANLALLAAAQPYSDNYYQAPKPQRSNSPSYMQSSSIRPSATTRHKGKEIAKPVTPQSESVSEEDNDPGQARRQSVRAVWEAVR
ncbi:hypothetical protein Tco_1291336 [Tanacetum coccineum]